MTATTKKTGLVVYQEPKFWVEVEQRVLELKKIGIKTNKANEAARLMQLGLAQVNKEYRQSKEFGDSILQRDELSD